MISLKKIPFLLSFLCLTFIVCGVVMNLLQLALYIIIWPINKNLFRRINKPVFEVLHVCEYDDILAPT